MSAGRNLVFQLIWEICLVIQVTSFISNEIVFVMMVKYIRNALAQTYYMLLLYLLALLKTFKKAIRKKLLVYRHSTHPL